jgi:hypothetical protein
MTRNSHVSPTLGRVPSGRIWETAALIFWLQASALSTFDVLRFHHLRAPTLGLDVLSICMAVGAAAACRRFRSGLRPLLTGCIIGITGILLGWLFANGSWYWPNIR